MAAVWTGFKWAFFLLISPGLCHTTGAGLSRMVLLTWLVIILGCFSFSLCGLLSRLAQAWSAGSLESQTPKCSERAIANFRAFLSLCLYYIANGSWPKQVTQPSPESRNRVIDSNGSSSKLILKRCMQTGMGYVCVHYLQLTPALSKANHTLKGRKPCEKDHL